jgi:hypothetical protein
VIENSALIGVERSWLKVALTALLAAALVCIFPARGAFAVNMHNPREQKDLSPALRNSLDDKLSDASQPYFSAEEEKKAKNQKYIDLQQKFEYLPNYGPGGRLVVSCKLGGAEYDPGKSGAPGKGAATGKLYYLVFTYALQNNDWVQAAKPKWEHQDLGAAAGKKMTASADRAEKAKAARARAAELQKALNQKTSGN